MGRRRKEPTCSSNPHIFFHAVWMVTLVTFFLSYAVLSRFLVKSMLKSKSTLILKHVSDLIAHLISACHSKNIYNNNNAPPLKRLSFRWRHKPLLRLWNLLAFPTFHNTIDSRWTKSSPAFIWFIWISLFTMLDIIWIANGILLSDALLLLSDPFGYRAVFVLMILNINSVAQKSHF